MVPNGPKPNNAAVAPISNRDQANNNSLVPVANRFLREKELANKEMLSCVEWMPSVPQVVMKVSIAQSSVINTLIKSLTGCGL